MSIIFFTLVSLVLVTPLFEARAFSTLQEVIPAVGGILRALIPVIFGLALVFFLWGLTKFIIHAADEKKREEAKSIMLWGIIALFVMASV